MKITILKRKRIQLVTSTDASNHSLHPAAAGFVYRRSNIEFVNENIVNLEVRPKGGDFLLLLFSLINSLFDYSIIRFLPRASERIPREKGTRKYYSISNGLTVFMFLTANFRPPGLPEPQPSGYYRTLPSHRALTKCI